MRSRPAAPHSSSPPHEAHGSSHPTHWLTQRTNVSVHIMLSTHPSSGSLSLILLIILIFSCPYLPSAAALALASLTSRCRAVLTSSSCRFMPSRVLTRLRSHMRSVSRRIASADQDTHQSSINQSTNHTHKRYSTAFKDQNPKQRTPPLSQPPHVDQIKPSSSTQINCCTYPWQPCVRRPL